LYAFRKLPEARKEARRIANDDDDDDGDDDDDDDDAQDERDIEWPSQTVKLSDGKCLVYWQISKYVVVRPSHRSDHSSSSFSSLFVVVLDVSCNRRLALLGACSAAEYEKMQGMMEFNVVLLRQGILDMLDASQGM
jgi:hypothetical protein